MYVCICILEGGVLVVLRVLPNTDRKKPVLFGPFSTTVF